MKKIKYLLVMLFVFICSCIKVNAADFTIRINTTQDVLNQYSDYTLKLSFAIDRWWESSSNSRVYQVSYDDINDTIEFNDDGIAFLNVHLSNTSTDITISGSFSYDRIKTEFDETKESTRMTGQSAMVDEDMILGGYFMSYDHMQIWNIESKDAKTNISFKKYFEDTGFETYRPSSSTFYLYNKKDLNTVVATTSINYENNSLYEFDGLFTNVPKYDTDGSEIEYTIIEEKVPYYSNSTDSKYGLKIQFNDQSKMGYEHILRLYYKENETNKLYEYYYTPFSIGDDLGGEIREIIPNSGTFSNSSSTTLADLANFASQYADFPDILELVGNRYPKSRNPYPLGESHVWHYKSSISNHSQDFYMSMRTESWGGHFGLLIDTISNIGTDTILTSTINLRDLEVTKKWEDTGYESYRPDSVTFKIYDKNDMNTVIKTVTLNKNNHAVDNNTWKLTIKNLPKYDKDNQEIEYVIVEDSINNYLTLYDYSDEFNGLKIKFSDDTFIEAAVCYYSNSLYDDEKCLFYNGQGYGQSIYIQNDYGVGPLTGQTLYIPTKYFRIYYRFNNSREMGADFVHKIKIDDISLYNGPFPSYTISKSLGSSAYPLGRHYLIDYLEDSMLNKMNYDSYDFMWEYEWKGAINPQGNATIVRNLINLQDIEFTKQWNDEGFESYRPNNVTFKLYNENDLNTVVKEITLSSDNVSSNDSNIWNGIFKDVPKYNLDGTEIKYIIKEDPIDNYMTTYTVDNIKGFLVTFDNDSYANSSVKVATIRSSINMHYALYHKYGSEFSNYFKDLANKTIYIPAGEFNRFIIDYSNQNATQGNDYGFKITSIVPVNYDDGCYQPYSGYDFYYLDEYNYFSGDNYPESTHPNDDAQIYVYSYEPLSTPFAGANIIINDIGLKKVEVTKKWEDIGNEEYRPNSIQINIYNVNDMNTPVITDTLSKNDKKDDYTWYKAYNLPKYDSNKEEIDYIVVETPIDYYTTSYTSTNEYNGLEIKFYKNSTTSNNSFMVFYPLNDNTLAIVAKTNDYFVHTSGANIEADSATIRIPSTEFYLIQNNSDIKIEYIKPIVMDTNEFLYGESSISSLSENDIVEVTGNEYINIDNSNPIWHYTLGKFSNPNINSNVITNETNFKTYEFNKLWDDVGYSYARPDKIKYTLHNAIDDSVVKEIYLTKDNEIMPYIWKGVFNGVPKYNNDGTVANYYVKEEKLDSYDTTYLINDIKGYWITFDSQTSTNNFVPIFLENNGQIYIVFDESGMPHNENFYAGKTIYVPAININEDKIRIALYPSQNDSDVIKITSIIPTTEDNPDYTLQIIQAIDEYIITDFTGNNYPYGRGQDSSISFLRYTPTTTSTDPFTADNVIRNTVKLMNVTFNKVDENGNKVVGAKILITTLDGTHVADFITDGNEKVLTLPVGEYLIVEEYAPDGYEVADDIMLKITDDGKVFTDGSVTDIVKIVDEKVVEKEIIPEQDNPKTIDNLFKYIEMFIISILSFGVIITIVLRIQKRND